MAEHRATRRDDAGSPPRMRPGLGELRDRTVLLTLLGVGVFLVWLGIALYSYVRERDLPASYWLPLWFGVPAYSIYALKHYIPAQDFSPRPWNERGREIVNLFRWRTMGGREWGLWLISIGFIPIGVSGMVIGLPYSRLGSGIVTIVCAAIGWVGLKCLDARIARRRIDEQGHTSER